MSLLNEQRILAETLLGSLGVSHPDHIDLEAIAYHCGAVVKYRPMDGCDARIVGDSKNAVISVNSRSKPERKRFSIGHELGHWLNDRGKAYICSKGALNDGWQYRSDAESIANIFSSNLLLPRFLFQPLAKERPPDFSTVEDLATLFRASLTATALALVKYASFPSILVCYGVAGRKWYELGPDVPPELRPHKELNHETKAFDLLYEGGQRYPRSVLSPAALWISHRSSRHHQIEEHSVKVADDDVLVLLWWRNPSQIEEVGARIN